MRKLVFLLLLGVSLPAAANSPAQILAQLQADAGSGASAERGKQLYHGKFSGEKAESCATCHTSDPKGQGRHVRTHKVIDPLAPVANPERFTDMAKVEKWFKRNCNEVLNRQCTAQEKADFAAYILSLK
jgi:cytochrome c peroxidase